MLSKLVEKRLFQSTLPLRGATELLRECGFQCNAFQSTLPLRGATVLVAQKTIKQKFQSTLPLRGATQNPYRKESQ